MRAPVIHQVHALTIIILAAALIVTTWSSPRLAVAEEDVPLAASGEGSGIIASALAEGSLRVSADVALAGSDDEEVEPVVGSFTVDGITYAVTGDAQVALAAVAPATLAGSLVGAPSGEGSGSGVPTSPSPSPEGALSDDSGQRGPGSGSSGGQEGVEALAQGAGSSEGSGSDDANAPSVLELPGSVDYDGVEYSVTSIGPRAFVGCDADAVSIPATVTSVDEFAFRGSSAKGVEVAEGNQNLASCEGVLYDADYSDLLLIPEGKEGAVRIHEKASAITPGVLSHCASVTSVEVDAGNGSFASRNGCLYDASDNLLWAPPGSEEVKALGTTLSEELSGSMGAAAEALGMVHDMGVSAEYSAGTLNIFYKERCIMRSIDASATSWSAWSVASEGDAWKVHATASGYKLYNGILYIKAPSGSQSQRRPNSATGTWDNVYVGSSKDGPWTRVNSSSTYTAITGPVYFKLYNSNYTITLDKQSGSGGTNTLSVEPPGGGRLPSVSVPSRSGYSFGGYYSSAGGSGTQYFDSSGTSVRDWDYSCPTTLYAAWGSRVSFNANGGSGGQATDVFAIPGKTMPSISATQPTRTGYKFMGWYDSADNAKGTQYYTAEGKSACNWDKWGTAAICTLYAHWEAKTYTCYFRKEGGQGGNDTITVTYGQPWGAITIPSRAGYKFLGYFADTTTANIAPFWDSEGKKGSAYSVWRWDQDGVVHARWAALDDVSFNVNGGKGNGYQTSKVTAARGENMPAISTTAPTRDGYSFQGWYDNADYSKGIQYYTAAGASARKWDKTGAATLYAGWKANTYVVRFDANGGKGGQSADVRATYDADMPAISTTAPTRDGYSFTGWYDSASGGTQYYTAEGKSARKWQRTSGVTLYAGWKASTYAVEFNANGGKGGQSAKVTATYDADMPAISTTAPTRTGYAFGGWYDNADYSKGTQYYTAAGASARKWDKTGATTLYAGWKASTYAVEFNANGGKGGQSKDVSATYDADMPEISKTAPTRTGYTFQGWYDSDDCSKGTQYYTADGKSARKWDKVVATTLYAGWRASPYAITYDPASGELAEDARTSYTIEDAFDLPAPKRYGYQFNGWEVSGVAEDGSAGPVLGAGVEDATAEDGSKVTHVKAGTYGGLSCRAKWTLRYDMDVPVTDPGSVTFEADSLTGQVRVAPGTSAEGAILSYMAVPVALDSLSCEGLDESGQPDPDGGAPELEAIFGAGSASKVIFTATLEAEGMNLALKVSAGQVASPPALATLSIPAATSHEAPGRIKVSYGLELDSDLPIPPIRDAAPVARLAYTVSLPQAGS